MNQENASALLTAETQLVFRRYFCEDGAALVALPVESPMPSGAGLFPTRFLTAAVVLLGLAFDVAAESDRDALVAPRPTRYWASDEQITEWIAELDAPRYATREQATRRLSEQPRIVIEPLLIALDNASPETQVRILRVLDHLHRSGQAAKTDAAEKALRRAARSDRLTVAQLAEGVLQRNYLITQQRAVAEIERFGGVVAYERTDVPWQIQSRPPDPGRIEHVVIGTSWRGGDAGIEHVGRLTQLEKAYIIRSSPVSEEAKEKLLRQVPGLEIEARGKAFLGVQMATRPGGCLILNVTPRSAAEKAGLLKNDIIFSFDGQPTPDPETLIEMMEQRKPGDKIKVRFIRGNDSKTVTVQLGTWDR